MKRLTAFGAMLLLSVLAQAKTIHVPKEAATLAAALQAASAGDTIMLAAGDHTVSAPLNIDKAVTVASRFVETRDKADIDATVVMPARIDMEEWVELSARGARVVGITFRGGKEHTMNITAGHASVLNCKFLGGKDQLSITRGGGHIAHCYFENAGDDSMDCDHSIPWVIEHNTIVNAHQDGIEIRLHDKGAPLTTHVFRNNIVMGSGQSGLQMIDYRGDSFREFRIHNNLFIDCKGSGVSCMYQEKDDTNEVYRGSLMQERAYVYNNTFDGCNYGLTLAPHLVILNNIFANSKTRGVGRGIYLTDSVDRSIVDYCLFYNNAQHFDPGIRKGERVIVDRDPRFGQNHALQKESPCIDAGTAQYSREGGMLAIPKTGYRGAAPDLGAKEFGADPGAAALLNALRLSPAWRVPLKF